MNVLTRLCPVTISSGLTNLGESLLDSDKNFQNRKSFRLLPEVGHGPDPDYQIVLVIFFRLQKSHSENSDPNISFNLSPPPSVSRYFESTNNTVN